MKFYSIHFISIDDTIFSKLIPQIFLLDSFTHLCKFREIKRYTDGYSECIYDFVGIFY